MARNGLIRCPFKHCGYVAPAKRFKPSVKPPDRESEFNDGLICPECHLWFSPKDESAIMYPEEGSQWEERLNERPAVNGRRTA